MANWKLRFFPIWTGQAFSLLGSSLVSFALVWWLTEQTGSQTVLATGSLVTLLPTVFLGPLTGTMVDRWSRRRVILIADASIALCTAILAYLFWRGVVETWHLYVIMFLRSLGNSFHEPAMMASTSLMVPEQQLTRVAGMNQTLHGLLRIAAPPLGAFLLGVLPLYGVLAIDIGTAMIAILPLLFVQIPNPAKAPTGTPTTILQDTWAGFRYVWGWRALFWIVLTCSLTDFFTAPGLAFLPLMVTRDLGGNAMQLGMISSATGIGLVAGGFFMTLWGGFKRRIVTSLVGWAAVGAACVALGLSPTFAWALGSALAIGLTLPIGSAAMMAFFQSCVAPEQQGRFFGVMAAISCAMMPLGLIVAGVLGPTVGPRGWRVLMGIAHMTLALGWVLVPSILYIEDHMQRGRLAGQAALDAGTG